MSDNSSVSANANRVSQFSLDAVVLAAVEFKDHACPPSAPDPQSPWTDGAHMLYNVAVRIEKDCVDWEPHEERMYAVALWNEQPGALLKSSASDKPLCALNERTCYSGLYAEQFDAFQFAARSP